MIKLLTESISIMLDAAFGGDYTIYQESIEQDLKEPCFFIQCLEAGNNLFRGKRYFREHQMCIQYFPVSRNNPKAECEAVAEQLYPVLECVTLHEDQTMIRGREMRHKTVDGVLNFFVNYDLFVMKKGAFDPMQTLDVAMKQKGDQNNGKT